LKKVGNFFDRKREICFNRNTYSYSPLMIHYVENIENKTFLTVIGEMFRDYPEFINMYNEMVEVSSTLEKENKDSFFESIKSFFSSIKNMNLYLKEGGGQDDEKKFVQEIKNQYNRFVHSERIYKNKIQEIQEKNENLEVSDIF